MERKVYVGGWYEGGGRVVLLRMLDVRGVHTGKDWTLRGPPHPSSSSGQRKTDRQGSQGQM